MWQSINPGPQNERHATMHIKIYLAYLLHLYYTTAWQQCRDRRSTKLL